jgi:hypothetical protein
MSDQAYKTAGIIVRLCIAICTYTVDSKLEDKRFCTEW